MATFAPVRPLRREEKTLWSSHAAHAWTDEGCDVVVIDEFPTTLSACDEVESRARLVLGLRHPNLATVRDVARSDESCKVATDWVDGERLDTLLAAGTLEAEMAIRIVIDVLSGLGGLHDHDARVVHGHVEPANVIAGRDGVARLVRPYLGPGRLVVIEAGAMHRVAPEVIKEAEVDRRADVYGVGVLLKELLPESLPRWGARLSEIVATALAAQPWDRYPTTADMARELRLVASSHVASHAKIASAVDRIAGERIDARRVELEPPAERPPEPAPATPRKPPLLPTMRIAVRPAVVHAASQTTRMLRASLRRVSRMWAVTLGVAVVLGATLVWIGMRPSAATLEPPASPPPPPTVLSMPPAPSAPVTVTEIELVDAPPAATHKTRTPRTPPPKPIDRSAVF
ncbi:MAG TPA: protein kinase [Polyangiaceae bacterium]|jgi:serine/threonine protein kinase